ncbi:hypothetical protein ACFQZC_18785 [Streptacidiphilus monticola]
MSLPSTSTQVTFPAGEVTGRSQVLACVELPEGRWGVVTASTPSTRSTTPGPTSPPTAALWRTVSCSTASPAE